ncbi:MAG: hypothetical protein QOD99_1207 [Chthoniobacter sp.]|jgi:HAD superfamily hydrolase (TIGR01484 family)|nr:hypothetical protein [Chthoniobacter sp.]
MIKLLSTDFDGTLVSHFASPPVAPELFSLLRGLRKKGVFWAVNTGREVDHIVHGLAEFSFPLEPDFVLTSERDIFRKSQRGTGWEPFGDWNERCARDHDGLFEQAEPLLNKVLGFLEQETRAEAIYQKSRPVGIVAHDETEMDRIVAFIEAAREELPLFSFQRNTQYLRFCHADYSKGAALGELGRLLGISREEIFAGGDHHNDIPMLDGRFARWVMCPANSAEATQETVRAAGGYVARGEASEGVVEALRHFLSMEKSALPEGQ